MNVPWRRTRTAKLFSTYKVRLQAAGLVLLTLAAAALPLLVGTTFGTSGTSTIAVIDFGQNPDLDTAYATVQEVRAKSDAMQVVLLIPAELGDEVRMSARLDGLTLVVGDDLTKSADAIGRAVDGRVEVTKPADENGLAHVRLHRNSGFNYFMAWLGTALFTAAVGYAWLRPRPVRQAAGQMSGEGPHQREPSEPPADERPPPPEPGPPGQPPENVVMPRSHDSPSPVPAVPLDPTAPRVLTPFGSEGGYVDLRNGAIVWATQEPRNDPRPLLPGETVSIHPDNPDALSHLAWRLSPNQLSQQPSLRGTDRPGEITR